MMRLGIVALLFSFSSAFASPLSTEFAFRSVDSKVQRRVVVQGSRDAGAEKFSQRCGPTGARCECRFYNMSRNEEVGSEVVGLSQEANSFSCTIAGAADPASYTFVRVYDKAKEGVTNRLQIKTALSLQEVLGKLSPNKVNKILQYSCTRSFFEGEGVGTSQISCVSNQRLGLITADYRYYLYESREGTNKSQKFGTAYWDAICSRPAAEFARVSCQHSAPETRFGLFNTQTAPFVVRVQMTHAPEGEELTTSYGFAALPDSSGQCPSGLVPARPWVAQPASITEGSLDGMNPPSSFVNLGEGALDDTAIDVVQPRNFTVNRQPNVTPCAAGGSCIPATFGGMQQVQSVSYLALSPVVCVIPKNLLSGI